jgi:hypothetical protein
MLREASEPLMFPSSKLTGPVNHSLPDSDTVVLTCDRSLKWPAAVGLTGAGLLFASLGIPHLFVFVLPCAVALAVAALYFAALRADVVVSRKSGTLELRPKLPFYRCVRIPFSEIREFLLEPEFDLGPTPKGPRPFVWHLSAVTTDNEYHELTWHFTRQAIAIAAEEASRITGKPLREQSDPYKSRTWSRWGYNFLR